MIINQRYTRSNGTIGIKTHSDQPSKTNKDHKKMVDVNHIMDRFLKTGQLTHVSNSPMSYTGEELPQHTNLQTSLHFIKDMEETYKNLNKKFKKQFKTFEEFIEFVDDPQNKDELQKILAPKTTTTSETTTTKKEQNSEVSSESKNETPS